VALASTHITQPSIYHVDKKGKPTFQEIKDEQLRGAYKWEYYDNMIYYNLFTELAEAQNRVIIYIGEYYDHTNNFISSSTSRVSGH
jgi:hypothetical protein